MWEIHLATTPSTPLYTQIQVTKAAVYNTTDFLPCVSLFHLHIPALAMILLFRVPTFGVEQCNLLIRDCQQLVFEQNEEMQQERRMP